jgi:hypothetical protein
MSDWPPNLEKPPNITEEEWQVFCNSRVENIPPELNRKVRAALGLDPRKGHVPVENLDRYRRRAELAFLMQRMGGMVSGLGEYADANTLWAMAGKYKRMANELRADLPEPPSEEEL